MYGSTRFFLLYIFHVLIGGWVGGEREIERERMVDTVERHVN